jgi:hypothetical protein
MQLLFWANNEKKIFEQCSDLYKNNKDKGLFQKQEKKLAITQFKFQKKGEENNEKTQIRYYSPYEYGDKNNAYRQTACAFELDLSNASD